MLFEEIIRQKDKIRFHTPGHSRPNENLLSCDVTELSYSDNLLSPNGEIAKLEKILASAYSAEAAFLSTQGATLNIFMAVYAVKDDGDILVIGNAHRSVYNALRLFKSPAFHADNLNFDDIPESVKSVVLTSPDYFGRTVDLEKIYPVLKEKGITLIVDSAHGAHFAFSSKLPVSASEHSDLAILSMHKTLPVITGGSVLTCKKKYADKCLYARSLLHTTSPNYMTMCSIEQCVFDFAKNGENYYSEIKNAVENFRENLKNPFLCEDNGDFSRLVVSSPYDGEEVSKALFDRGFVAETSVGNKVIFIVTKYNFMHLSLLCRCISELPPMKIYREENFPFPRHDKPVKLNFDGEWILVPLDKAIGRKFCGEAGLYPPGSPLLWTGDTVTKEIARYFMNFPERSFGLENGYARVLK